MLQRLGLWLARKGGWAPDPPCTHDELVMRLQAALTEADLVGAQYQGLSTAHDQLLAQITALVTERDQVRYHDAETMRAHTALIAQITEIVAERDRARADFAQYAQQQLEVRADVRVRAEYLVGTLHKKGQHLAGEFKRHQVYADLLKEFPDVRRRDLGLAIEMAVRAKT
jgi:hypothetical protein